MAKPKLTPWIAGGIKPTFVGVYQRRYDPFYETYCLWDGAGWRWGGKTIDDAVRVAFIFGESAEQHLPWRGLAEDPNKQPKKRK